MLATADGTSACSEPFSFGPRVRHQSLVTCGHFPKVTSPARHHHPLSLRSRQPSCSMYTCLAALPGLHDGPLNVLSFSPPDTPLPASFLVTAGQDGSSFIVSVTCAVPCLVLRSPPFQMTSIVWLPSGSFIAGWNNGMVIEFKYDVPKVRCFVVSCFRPRFEYLLVVVSCLQNALFICSVLGAKALGPIRALAARQQDNRSIVVLAADCEIQIWERSDAGDWNCSLTWPMKHANMGSEGYVVSQVDFLASPGLRVCAFLLGGYVW